MKFRTDQTRGDPPLVHSILLPHGYAAIPVLDAGAVIVVIFVLTIVGEWLWLTSLGIV